MTTELASILQSRTVWANIIGMAAFLLSRFGLDGATLDQPALVDAILSAVTTLSFVASAFFRVVATRRIV
jgi:hypothetical protein